MKKLLTGCLWLCVVVSFAQQAEPLIFRERTYDFGDVQESQGSVDHEFIFTNNSGRPVKIMNVRASCGCTTPGWTKDIIPQGKTGFVRASFDPKGRPGYFNKSLTVLTDLENGEMVLQIKGQVVNASTDGLPLSVELGSLRMSSRHLNFGKVYLNREAVQKEFHIYNAGNTTIHISEVTGPPHLKIVAPSSLQPQEKGVLRITFDAKKRNQFGFVSDNIQLHTDDPAGTLQQVSVLATLEEFYPRLTPEEQAKAPVLSIREPVVDLGRYNTGTTLEKSVFVLNTGKKDLTIKALQPNCTCVTASFDQPLVHPGDSAAIKITFTPQNRIGTQQKAVSIYSNDPRSPVQMIQLQVFVEK